MPDEPKIPVADLAAKGTAMAKAANQKRTWIARECARRYGGIIEKTMNNHIAATGNGDRPMEANRLPESEFNAVCCLLGIGAPELKRAFKELSCADFYKLWKETFDAEGLPQGDWRKQPALPPPQDEATPSKTTLPGLVGIGLDAVPQGPQDDTWTILIYMNFGHFDANAPGSTGRVRLVPHRIALCFEFSEAPMRAQWDSILGHQDRLYRVKGRVDLIPQGDPEAPIWIAETPDETPLKSFKTDDDFPPLFVVERARPGDTVTARVMLCAKDCGLQSQDDPDLEKDTLKRAQEVVLNCLAKKAILGGGVYEHEANFKAVELSRPGDDMESE